MVSARPDTAPDRLVRRLVKALGVSDHISARIVGVLPVHAVLVRRIDLVAGCLCLLCAWRRRRHRPNLLAARRPVPAQSYIMDESVVSLSISYIPSTASPPSPQVPFGLLHDYALLNDQSPLSDL